MGRPNPVNVTDELLLQILDRLDQICDHLAPPPAPGSEAGPVEVREPERPAARAAETPSPATRGRSQKRNTRPVKG